MYDLPFRQGPAIDTTHTGPNREAKRMHNGKVEAIDHFRVALRLFFQNESSCEITVMKNAFNLKIHFHANQTHFNS